MRHLCRSVPVAAIVSGSSGGSDLWLPAQEMSQFTKGPNPNPERGDFSFSSRQHVLEQHTYRTFCQCDFDLRRKSLFLNIKLDIMADATSNVLRRRNQPTQAEVEIHFHSAVKVIRNIPKSGNFQISTDMLLQFYALYKQSLDGPCAQQQPSIWWDPRAYKKWESWSGLGNMTKHDAMQKYVEQLKSIVETMSLSGPVSEFLDELGSFYEVVETGDDGASTERGESAKTLSDIMMNGTGTFHEMKMWLLSL